MDLITILVFTFLAVAPLAIAIRYGDRMLDELSRRRRQRKKVTRQRKTRSLPIRSEEIDRLLAAEGKRDAVDDSIAQSLEALARLSTLQPREDSESEIEEIEQAILANESQFSVYLDYAWFQSETLEVLSEEARLLRQLADLPENGLPVLARGEQDRRSKADQKLSRIGHVPGSRFDATVDDDSGSVV
jgi:hypothetical protein